MATEKIKIKCAVSGGVDSAVAAALLKEVGDFEVEGVFMELWHGSDFELAKKRAKNVCQELGIPFSVLNFQTEFKKKIVDCFLEELKKGFTPNPCVLCNKKIKFGLLWEKAGKLSADMVATGHYARIREKGGLLKLIRGKDEEKDQSYFLWKLNQKQLRRVLFPVGGYTKREVKKMAKYFGLPAIDSPESQEICFVRDTTRDFLKKHLKTKPGKIVNTEGKIIGEHEGLWFYTIGQRKGIELSGGPHFVVDKKTKENFLVVTKDRKDLYGKELMLKDVNWISGIEPELPMGVKAKIRYRHSAAEAILSKQKGEKYLLEFKKPQFAVTSGQSAVFYKRDEVLGGGIIV